MTSAVAFVPYGDFSPATVLGSRLHALVQSNLTRISRDFPGVPARYATPDVAAQTVESVATTTVDGRYAYAVTYAGVVIGVATISQEVLRRGIWPARYTVVEGPLFALWLGARDERNGAPAPLLPVLLRHLAQQMRDNGAHGHPWTIVNVDHPHVQGCLGGHDNGFGGLAAVGKPKTYRKIDGGKSLRQLYVAHTIIR